MADILNQALKDANYGVSGKNSGPAVYYKITAYSFTRPDPTSDDIEYSVTVAAFMNSGGSMGSGTPLDLKIQLSILNSSIIFDKYIKQSVSWSGRGDSTATATVTFTGHTNLVAEGTQTVKLIGYRPNQTSDVISSSNSAPGKKIGSGEVTNSSYTMNFPTKSCPHTSKRYVAGDDPTFHEVYCDTCDAYLGNEVHTFTNDICTLCGYKKPCQHPNKRYLYTGIETHAIYCDDCDVYLGNESCNFVNNKCTLCGHEKTAISYYVNINNTWVPCEIKVNVKGPGYEYIENSGNFETSANFEQYSDRLDTETYVPETNTLYYGSYDNCNFWLLQNLDTANYGWGERSYDDGRGFAIYIKSDNVKQWMDCDIQFI